MRSAINARHGGQLALVGVIALMATLIALENSSHPAPIFAYERGQLQEAVLVYAARECLATRNCTETLLQRLLNAVYSLNDSEGLMLFRIVSINMSSLRKSGYSEDRIEVVHERGTVEVAVIAEIVAEDGYYVKRISGRAVAMRRLTLKYVHVYTGAYLGKIVLCPRIKAGSLIDVSPVAPCKWSIGVPTGRSAYVLEDEFGVPVTVVVGDEAGWRG